MYMVYNIMTMTTIMTITTTAATSTTIITTITTIIKKKDTGCTDMFGDLHCTVQEDGDDGLPFPVQSRPVLFRALSYVPRLSPSLPCLPPVFPTYLRPSRHFRLLSYFSRLLILSFSLSIILPSVHISALPSVLLKSSSYRPSLFSLPSAGRLPVCLSTYLPTRI
jgi:hypothetical protein